MYKNYHEILKPLHFCNLMFCVPSLKVFGKEIKILEYWKTRLIQEDK